MASQVRWARSPDGCALIVVQDPAAVEAEPVPNGFLFANERGRRVFQRDSVWDVAPSGDWQRLAYAVAFGAQPRGPAESLSTSEWKRFAARVGVEEAAVRRSAFSCSGMAYWFCVARLVIAELPVPARTDSTGVDTVRALTTLAGWRVRWRADGATLIAGTGPRGSQDHSPPERWLVVDVTSGEVRDTVALADTTGLAAIAWTAGPTLTYGETIDLAPRSELPIDGGVVRSENGTIEIRWSTGRTLRVGAGRALSATRGGRFIAAVVPAASRREPDWGYELVVFEIVR